MNTALPDPTSQQALNSAALDVLEFMQTNTQAPARMLFALVPTAELKKQTDESLSLGDDPLTCVFTDDNTDMDTNELLAGIEWNPLTTGCVLAQHIRFVEPDGADVHPAILVAAVLKNGNKQTLLKTLDDSVEEALSLRGGDSIAPELIDALAETLR